MSRLNKMKWTHLNIEISHAAFREERNIHDSTFLPGPFIKWTRNWERPPLDHSEVWNVGGGGGGDINS